MKKYSLIIALCLILVVIFSIVLVQNHKSNGSGFESAKAVINMFDTIYSNLEGNLPYLETMELDASDEVTVSIYTGLNSNENIESLVVSEPLTSSQAYSAVVVILKDGSNIDSVKQEMLDNIDMNKWVCVSAEKMYITNYGNAIFMVMSAEDWASSVYSEFKKCVNNEVGTELEKTAEVNELPPEIIIE